MNSGELSALDDAALLSRWRMVCSNPDLVEAWPVEQRNRAIVLAKADSPWVESGIDRLRQEQERVQRAATVLGASPTVELLRGADITPEPIRWLWAGYLARGKLHVIAGAPGAGKTTIALAMAATITCAGRWPDGTRAEVGSVLIWSGEDDPADTLLPRLIAMGADVNRVYFVRDVLADGKARPFDPARDMAAMECEAERIGDVRLLIVDPVVNVVAGDSHKNTETRRALQPVVDLARRMDAAAVGISHFSKGTAGRDPVERVTGSVAFGALPRVVFAAAKRPDEDGGGRILVRSKSNIGPDGGGFAYDLEQVEIAGGIRASQVLWGAPLDGTARELLAAAEAVEEDRTATAEATDWLRDMLAERSMKAGEVQKQAKSAGIGDKALRRARERLGVRPHKSAFSGGWEWALPTAQHAQGVQDAPQKERASSGGEGIFGSGTEGEV